MQQPNKKSVYELEQIDEPLESGYGNFALIYETKNLIRKDFYEFLVGIGVRNIQVFEIELLGIKEKQEIPNYLNFNIVGIINFELIRELSNPYSDVIKVLPDDHKMVLLDTSDGTGNIIVHEYTKDRIEAQYSNQIYFESIEN